MLNARARLVLLLVVFHLGLGSAAAMQVVDFAWAPSYFDDDDGDFLPVFLSNQMPALPDRPAGWMPVLALLAVVALCHRTGHSRLAVSRARFRAPPLP